MAEPRTLKVIIVYKAIKGGVLMLLGLGLSIAVWVGHVDGLHALAMSLRENVTARLAVDLAELLLKISTPAHLQLTSLAIALDGAVGIVESWLLHRQKRWAIALVVVASSALVPWEIYELIAHFRILRLVLLVLNVAVVLYLFSQTRRHLERHVPVGEPVKTGP